nr:MAG TPA: hypothetical protein [Bacteriophage sp.]
MSVSQGKKPSERQISGGFAFLGWCYGQGFLWCWIICCINFLFCFVCYEGS